MMIHSLFAFVSGVSVMTIADKVPDYKYQQGCRAALEQMPGRYEKCVESEEGARAKLMTEWSKFSVADRTTCIGASSAGGSPSYVELLVCLGIKADVRDIRSKDQK